MTSSAVPDQMAFQKPTDLDLHFQRHALTRYIRIRVKYYVSA